MLNGLKRECIVKYVEVASSAILPLSSLSKDRAMHKGKLVYRLQIAASKGCGSLFLVLEKASSN